MPGHFNLSFDQFETTTTNTFKDLLTDEQFTDVTLACADDKQITAHKVILGSCSSILRNIIMTFPQQNPVIYLKGIKYDEMKSIIDFIYLGETKVKQEEFSSFMQIAQELNIKGLAVNSQELETVHGIPKTSGEKNIGVMDDVGEDIVKFMDDMGEDIVKTEKNHAERYEDFLSESSLIKPKSTKEAKYKCSTCEKKCTDASNLRRHEKAQHEGITYRCDSCDYKAKQPAHLRTHFRSKHSKTQKVTGDSEIDY